MRRIDNDPITLGLEIAKAGEHPGSDRNRSISSAAPANAEVKDQADMPACGPGGRPLNFILTHEVRATWKTYGLARQTALPGRKTDLVDSP